MKLFVSYPSDQRDLAERLRLTLEGEGHDVFTDRAELRAGDAYHAALRAAIEAADGAVFLLTPRAVARGSYTLTEVALAQRRWRRPRGHVLPVVVQPTPLAEIPAYLKAVTLLEPHGDVVAETVAEVARMAPTEGRWRRAFTGGALLLALAAGAAGWAWWQAREEQRVAAERLVVAQIDASSRLCAAGSFAPAFEALERLAEQRADDARARVALEDCAMRWLRNARVTRPAQGFADIVDRAAPVVEAGLPLAGDARRRADLLAHLGWADGLRARDGVAVNDPMRRYDTALDADPDNPYALAMRAVHLARRGAGTSEAVRRDLALAWRSGRSRDWVRSLQWGVAGQANASVDYAIQLADDMRLAGEPRPEESRSSVLWGAYTSGLRSSTERPQVMAALPHDRLLATFTWAFPQPGPDSPRWNLWRFAHAMIRSEGSPAEAAVALEDLRALRDELTARRLGGSMLDAIENRLKQAGTERR